MVKEIDEGLLARIWAGQWLEPSRLRTAGGVSLRVVFPGRPNGGGGPDFLGAIIGLEDGRLLRGDVELHVWAGDWESHGHHQDPAYDGVVLHGVWAGGGPWVRRRDGAVVANAGLRECATLPLEALMGLEGSAPSFAGGCRRVVDGLGPEGVTELLEAAGEARFMGKGVGYQGDLACFPGQEVLYRGLLGALGYSKNKEPFQRLARLVPLSALEGLARGAVPSHRPLLISALLLGVGGLLPCQDGVSARLPEWAGEAEGLWKGSGLGQGVKAREWSTAGVRPVNHPVNRMLGAGRLLARFVDGGLVEAVKERVLEAHDTGDVSGIEEALMVPGYVGRGLAREMAVNAVLPFFWALGEDRGDPALSGACLELFRRWPGGRENQITRQMRLRLFGDAGEGQVDTGRRQQGLIHLFKGACRYGFCPQCPLGRALARLRRGGWARRCG